MPNKFKELNWNPDQGEIKGFCKTLLLGFPIAGFAWLAIVWLIAGDWIWAIPIWFAGIGFFASVTGWCSYFLGCLYYKIWFFIIAVIDTVLTNLLLIVLFYCILTPYSLLIRIFKSDSMKRAFDPEAESYLEDAVEPKGPESYHNQF